MHYHNIFLTRADNKKHALELTEKFLIPYDENLIVEPYKRYLEETDVQNMVNYYKLNKEDPDFEQQLIDKIYDWDGGVDGMSGKDEKGFYRHREYSQNGEWDWYQWGGRYSWWDYNKEYEHVLFNPQTPEQKEKGWRTYRNRYHDDEIRGKKAEVTFPDGTKTLMEYGTPYPFQTWANNNPEFHDVIDATDITFWGRIEEHLGYWRSNMLRDREWQGRYEEQDKKNKESEKEYQSGMYSWAVEKGENTEDPTRYCTEKYFFNITHGNMDVPKIQIRFEPEKWFLVNVDLHS